MFHISCSIDKIVDAADLPKYPESVKAHPVVKGVDGALWSIQNLLSDINEMEYSDHSLNTCIEYWIDCINRCNHSWSAAIGLLPSSQTESLILFRSSIESALAISVPYHLKDERWESGNFTKFFFKFEDNKGDTTINSLWTKEIDKYSLVSTPVPKKHWIQIIRLLHKATHTIPNKLDKGDEMWGFHRTRDLINDFVEDEAQESYDVEFGDVYSGNAGLGTIGSRVSAAGTMSIVFTPNAGIDVHTNVFSNVLKIQDDLVQTIDFDNGAIESGFGNKQLYMVSKLAMGLGHMVIIAVSVS